MNFNIIKMHGTNIKFIYILISLYFSDINCLICLTVELKF